MESTNILNYKKGMEYRRFGKTNKMVSAITLGGMRYKHGWDEPREVVPDDTREECRDTVIQSLKLGINMFETAYGYKKSEHIYGMVLNDDLKLPRDSYYLMTKGAPLTADETRKLVEEQLTALKTDYVDFYGWHGINNPVRFKAACEKGGAVEALIKLKGEGLIRHVGFSTHGSLEIIQESINTDLFEFVNLHYYYFFQRNKPAIDLAEKKDMGVFIISPNDKGGQLANAPDKLKEMVKPLTPIQWNARFCLQTSSVHTLTFGAPKTSPLEEIPGIFPASVPLSEPDQLIKQTLDAQLELDPYSWYEGYDLLGDPSGINIPEVLRFRKLAKCYDMLDFGRYRYNMFAGEDHWFPGYFPNKDRLKKIDTSKVPEGVPLKELIQETHQLLYKPKKKKIIDFSKLKVFRSR